MNKKHLNIGLLLGLIFLIIVKYPKIIHAQTTPTIGTITVLTPGNIEQYTKFEISFPITTTNQITEPLTTSALNPYYMYYDDLSSYPGVERLPNGKGNGITVDILLLAPGQTDWANQAKKVPCFYYQPMEELGSGSFLGFFPKGNAQWRCRVAPTIINPSIPWRYKIQATDAFGTGESTEGSFFVVVPTPNSNNFFTRKGYIKVSTSDARFFEYSDGTPFVTSLVNPEDSGFGQLNVLRDRIPKLGQGGVRFIRWFPNSETGTVIPFAGYLNNSWSDQGWSTIDSPDTAKGKRFSFYPEGWTHQTLPAVAGAKYKLSFRAYVTGTKNLSASIEFTDGNGHIDTHTFPVSVNNAWQNYAFETTNTSNHPIIWVSFSDEGGTGKIRLSDMKFQQEISSGVWGLSMLQRGDTDTYSYVDQINAARMDEVMKLSEKYGVYHKLPLFWKEDYELARMKLDGTINEAYTADNTYTSPQAIFYENSYIRYFLGRWGYSTALHSFEYGNENFLSDNSYNAGWILAKFVRKYEPRDILMSNSFYGYFVIDFFGDPINKQYIDYGDKHWYSEAGSNDSELKSPIVNDSTAYARACYLRFREYANDLGYSKPIVQGEGGNGDGGTQESLWQNPGIMADIYGNWYHKKMWSHVGMLGYTCDGEWYPRLFVDLSPNRFPNSNYDVFTIFKNYEAFMSNEPLSNGSHIDIGTDNLTAETISCIFGDHCITNTNPNNLRAFGSKDAVSRRVLVWVDNKNNTWTTNPGGATAATGTFTISGIPNKSNPGYTMEIWDTRAGTHTTTVNAVNVTNGTLSFSATTGKDVAYKFYDPDVIIPSPTPGAAPSPSPLAGDVNGDHVVNGLDLKQLFNSFFSLTTPALDLDNSGKVNLLDAAWIIKQFGLTW